MVCRYDIVVGCTLFARGDEASRKGVIVSRGEKALTMILGWYCPVECGIFAEQIKRQKYLKQLGILTGLTSSPSDLLSESDVLFQSRTIVTYQ